MKTSLGGTRTLKEVIKEVTSSHTEVIGEVTRSTGVIKKKTVIKNELVIKINYWGKWDHLVFGYL